MTAAWVLTDKQWEKLSEFIPPHHPSKLGGRPRASDRKVLQGIIWILRTGAQWCALPRDKKLFASKSTCWRRLSEWTEYGVFGEIFKAFLAELNSEDRIDWEESFIDGTFASAKKGAKKLVRPRKAKVQK